MVAAARVEQKQMNEMLMTIICSDKPLKVYFHIIFCSYLLCKFGPVLSHVPFLFSLPRPSTLSVVSLTVPRAAPNNKDRVTEIQIILPRMKVVPGSICFLVLQLLGICLSSHEFRILLLVLLLRWGLR